MTKRVEPTTVWMLPEQWLLESKCWELIGEPLVAAKLRKCRRQLMRALRDVRDLPVRPVSRATRDVRRREAEWLDRHSLYGRKVTKRNEADRA